MAVELRQPGTNEGQAKHQMTMDNSREFTPHPSRDCQLTARCHDREAITCGTERVSYGELNRRSNRLAHQLIGLGVGSEVLVGICLDRSIGMIVGMLAVVKAGGAYLPLDPGTPEARLQATLADAQPRVVLTDRQHAPLVGSAAPVLTLDANPGLPEQDDSPGIGGWGGRMRRM